MKMTRYDKFMLWAGAILLTLYIWNGVKLVEAVADDHTGRIIVHGIGLFGPTCLITVWFP
jgi:hypothetical protein